MHTVRASDAKNRFAELVDRAQREPVRIERHGRPVAVMISEEDYTSYQQLYVDLLKTKIADAETAVKQGDVVTSDALFASLRKQLNRGAA